MGNRSVRGVVVVKNFMQRSDRAPAAALAQAQLPVLRRRTEIDQYPILFEDAVRLVQGMNHALKSHSSEYPGEHNNVECTRGIFQALRMSDVIGDALAVMFGSIFAGQPDAPWIGIYRLDIARPKRGKSQGQATIAAADLEHALAMPIRDTLQRAEFFSGRIHDERHTFSFS
jgi:hypothetical protein